MFRAHLLTSSGLDCRLVKVSTGEEEKNVVQKAEKAKVLRKLICVFVHLDLVSVEQSRGTQLASHH